MPDGVDRLHVGRVAHGDDDGPASLVLLEGDDGGTLWRVKREVDGMAKRIRDPRGLAALDAGEPGKPKYERLRQFLVEEVAAGRLKPGDMLPTEQQLADTYAIARSTVRQALATLTTRLASAASAALLPSVSAP